MLLPATLRMMIISEPHDCFILVSVAFYFHHIASLHFLKELFFIPLDDAIFLLLYTFFKNYQHLYSKQKIL